METPDIKVNLELDTTRLDAAFAELAGHKRYVPVHDRGTLPDRPSTGRWNNHLRPVLIPGKRKASRHPWADRLVAARTGGVSVDETHPGSKVLTMSCYRGCGTRTSLEVGTGQTRKEQKDEAAFREHVQHHVSGACVAVAS